MDIGTGNKNFRQSAEVRNNETILFEYCKKIIRSRIFPQIY